MKNNYSFVLLAIAVLALPLFALAQQKANYHWATKFDISDSDVTDYEGGPLIEMLVDQEGNSYLLGGFQEGLQLDAQTSLEEHPDGIYQYFLAKYNAKGRLEWYRTIRESEFGLVDVFDMVLDAQGQVLLGGISSADTTYLGQNDYLTSSCGEDSFCEDLFLVKFSPQGALISTQQISTKAGYFYDLRLNLDLQNNLFLTFFSYRTDSIHIANQSIKTLAEDAIFTCKLTPLGQLEWYRQGDQISASLELLDVSAQADGSFWALGDYEFGDEADFGDGFTLQSLPDIDPFYDQNYLIKHDAKGDIEWLSEINSEILYTRMVAGRNGDIYLVGIYTEVLYYNGRVVLSDIGINPNPDDDYTTFVLKIGSDGQIIWKKQFSQVAPYCYDLVQESSFLNYRSWAVDAAGRLLMPLYYLAYEPTTLEVEGRTIELPITYSDEEYSMYEWGGLGRIDRLGQMEFLMDFPLDTQNHFYPHFVRPGPNETFYLQGAMYIDTLRLGENSLITEDFISSVLTRFDFSAAQKRPSPADRPFPRPPAPIGESQLQVPVLDQGMAKVFPNPAQERLNIQLKQPISLESLQIRDQLGRILWRSGGSEHFLGAEVEVKHLAPGVYVLELFTAQQKLNFQFIKK